MNYNILSIAAVVAMVSCGQSENPDARELYNQADQAFQAGDYASATILLDSLQKGYPSEIGIQREAMSLRPKVIEKVAMLEIASIDSMANADKQFMEQLKPKLKWIKTPGMIEGYWIDDKAYKPDFMNSTGIEARVSEIGQFYVVSSSNPSVGHTSITLVIGDYSATTPEVAYDGESNYRIGCGEVITFSPEQSDTIGALAAKFQPQTLPRNIKITFNGSKAKKSVNLTTAQTQGIANAYRYSSSIIRARDNEVKRQRLMKTIEIAQRQMQTMSDKQS